MDPVDSLCLSQSLQTHRHPALCSTAPPKGMRPARTEVVYLLPEAAAAPSVRQNGTACREKSGPLGLWHLNSTWLGDRPSTQEGFGRLAQTPPARSRRKQAETEGFPFFDHPANPSKFCGSQNKRSRSGFGISSLCGRVEPTSRSDTRLWSGVFKIMWHRGEAHGRLRGSYRQLWGHEDRLIPEIDR